VTSGINLIMPWIDKPRAGDWHQTLVTPAGDSYSRRFRTEKIDLRETVYVFPRQNVITKDTVVEIDALIYSQITDPVRATYEIANLPDAIEKLTQTTLRNVIGEMELDTCCRRAHDQCQAAGDSRRGDAQVGAKVSRVELKDINPPRDIATMESRCAPSGSGGPRSSPRRRQAVAHPPGRGIRNRDQHREATSRRDSARRSGSVSRLKWPRPRRRRSNGSRRRSRHGRHPARYLIAIRYIETLKEMVSGQAISRVHAVRSDGRAQLAGRHPRC